MKKFVIKIILFYQKYLSPDTGLPKKLGFVRGKICGMYPSCSEYMKEAITIHGLFPGIRMGLSRISRCHPWQKNLFDPVQK